MPILARMLASPLFVDIRPGAVAGLAELLQDRFISTTGKVMVAVGPSQGEGIWRTLQPSMPDADFFAVTDASLGCAGELQQALSRTGYDAVVGIGGGRTLDVAKYAATRAGVPMVAVATNLAHDGICSPVASLLHGHGKGSYGVSMPLAVLVDLDYVRSAPPRLIRAGVGDVVSNLCAIADWQLAHRERSEPVDGLAVALAQSAAESVLRREDSVLSDDFLVTLAQALVLSGMAMSVAGSSRPCSGACHEFVHAVDQLFPGVADHGELAGVGALIATSLRGDDETFAAMLTCLRRHELPTSGADLGLTDAQLLEALAAAPETRPGRYTILEHLALGEAQLRDRVRQFTARLP